MWTMPLVHGFWQQRTLAVLGRMLTLSVIARRSRHFAGTRYPADNPPSKHWGSLILCCGHRGSMQSFVWSQRDHAVEPLSMMAHQ